MKAEQNWRIYGYDRNLLGEVCAETMGEARKLARATWPDKLAGDRLFDLVRGDMVKDPLIKLIQKAGRHE